MSKTIKSYKLGIECSDLVTGIKGVLTHCAVNMSHDLRYFFQPHGLDAGGKPAKKIVLEPARIVPAKGQEIDIVVPIEILGSKVSHKHTPFKGVATRLFYHLSGCIHVEIQPTEIDKVNNTLQDVEDFDLRECKGKQIKELSPTELNESLNTKPSPCSMNVSNKEKNL